MPPTATCPDTDPVPATPAPFIPHRFRRLTTHFPSVFSHHHATYPQDELLVALVRGLFSDPPLPLDADFQRTMLERVLHHDVAPNVPYTAEGILFEGVPRGKSCTVALTDKCKMVVINKFLETYTAGLSYLSKVRSESDEIFVVHSTMNSQRPFCAITLAHGLVAAPRPVPILPMKSSDPQAERFWTLLEHLWPHELIDCIRFYCSDPYSEGNSIVMSTSCRQAWNALEFCLIPVSSTSTKVTVKFQWAQSRHRNLPDHRYQPRVDEEAGALEWERMADGDIIEFRARKHLQEPLPDSALLYIRCVLVKMAVGMEVAISKKMLFGVGLKDCGCEDDGEAEGVKIELKGCWKGVDGWFDREFAGAGVFPKVWEQFAGVELANI